MKIDDFEFADSEIIDINLGMDFIAIGIKGAYNLILGNYMDYITIDFTGIIDIVTHKHVRDGSIKIDSDIEDSLPKIISNLEYGEDEIIISGSSKRSTDWYDTLIKFKEYKITPR